MTIKTAAVSALLGVAVAGCAYLGIALLRTLEFARRRSRDTGGQSDDGMVRTPKSPPAITVLKPLCGDEPGLYENLASFCDQDAADFQIIFGAREAADPAVSTARRIVAAFPNVDACIVIDDRMPAANRKISNVINMMREAKHPVLVVADSDVRVDRSYVRDIAAPFCDPTVGAVSCLYRAGGRVDRASAQHDIVGTLAAMFVEEQFAPSVLVATAPGTMDFCLGATMAVSRHALEAIGGFEAVGSYLADDQMLGRLVKERGLAVLLSSHVVETALAERNLGELWRHELRWAVTMHAARPLGYSLSFLTYGLVLACAYALASPARAVAVGLVLAAAALRVALHYAARAALRSTTADAPWLILPRDMLGIAVWAAHFFSRTIRWRDTRYRLDRRGQLEALTPSSQQPPAR